MGRDGAPADHVIYVGADPAKQFEQDSRVHLERANNYFGVRIRGIDLDAMKEHYEFAGPAAMLQAIAVALKDQNAEVFARTSDSHSTSRVDDPNLLNWDTIDRVRTCAPLQAIEQAMRHGTGPDQRWLIDETVFPRFKDVLERERGLQYRNHDGRSRRLVEHVSRRDLLTIIHAVNGIPNAPDKEFQVPLPSHCLTDGTLEHEVPSTQALLRWHYSRNPNRYALTVINRTIIVGAHGSIGDDPVRLQAKRNARYSITVTDKDKFCVNAPGADTHARLQDLAREICGTSNVIVNGGEIHVRGSVDRFVSELPYHKDGEGNRVLSHELAAEVRSMLYAIGQRREIEREAAAAPKR